MRPFSETGRRFRYSSCRLICSNAAMRRRTTSPFDLSAIRCLARAKQRIADKSKGDVVRRLIAALEQIKRHDEYLNRLPVSENGRILFVNAEEIDWIEANGNYARLHAGPRFAEIRET